MNPWVDLTRPVEPGMPVFPGDPEFSAETLTGEGFRLTRLSMGTHTGTHVDAPAHVFPEGLTLDELPLELFAGEAVVLDVRGSMQIGPEQLTGIDGARIVLLHTGWDVHTGTPRELYHPHLTVDGARFLRAAGVRTVGIDTASVDAPDTLAAHHVLLEGASVVVENLRGLGELSRQVEFFAFGWALTGGDGSPVRAVARNLQKSPRTRDERSRGRPHHPRNPAPDR